jgi:hypothetical protein
MTESYCTNYQSCRLIQGSDFPISVSEKEKYLRIFCQDEKSAWKQCKRYITKCSLGFCPDFVLPDIQLTISEIIDKFDEEEFDK